MKARNIMDNKTARWTQSLSVGIPVLDDDHKTLIEMLHAIFVACQMEGRHTPPNLLIDGMLEHIQHHFEREEEIMAEARYPDLHRHLDEHAKLFIQLSEILHVIRDAPVRGASEKIQSFLRNSLLGHIERDDMRFAAYVRDARAASVPKRTDTAQVPNGV